MFRHLSLIVVAAIVLGAQSNGQANPITYDFSGTFDRPMNGTDQFSGSFTINLDPTASNVGILSPNTGETSADGLSGIAILIFTLDPTQREMIGEYGNDVSL